MRLLLLAPILALLSAGAPAVHRAAPLAPLSPAVERRLDLHRERVDLYDRLMREEADNFAGYWVEREPSTIFAFKQDAEATLRRYTKNPNFVARQVRYSMKDLDQARDDARRQLVASGVPLGTSDSDEVQNDVDIVTLLDQPEVDALLASGGVRLHPAVNLTGLKPLPHPAITAEAARLVKVFPQVPHRSIGGTRELSHGKIILREGCLRFDGEHLDDPIILFARETGLRVDEAGRLAFYARGTGETLALVGEPLAMSGGSGLGSITDKEVTDPINAVCGPGSVTYGGWFESRKRFEGRVPS